LPEASTRRRNGSFGERSNLGSTQRWFAKGIAMMLCAFRLALEAVSQPATAAAVCAIGLWICPTAVVEPHGSDLNGTKRGALTSAAISKTRRSASSRSTKISANIARPPGQICWKSIAQELKASVAMVFQIAPNGQNAAIHFDATKSPVDAAPSSAHDDLTRREQKSIVSARADLANPHDLGGGRWSLPAGHSCI
jgi:hypothetical protein